MLLVCMSCRATNILQCHYLKKNYVSQIIYCCLVPPVPCESLCFKYWLIIFYELTVMVFSSIFLYFFISLFFFISLISNHLYSHVKLDTYGSHSILISNYILVVLTSRSVTHPHTAPPLARLISLFPSIVASKTVLATSWYWYATNSINLYTLKTYIFLKKFQINSQNKQQWLSNNKHEWIPNNFYT
jgi:hypothetical protein